MRVDARVEMGRSAVELLVGAAEDPDGRKIDRIARRIK
jgi:hypothetical protein